MASKLRTKVPPNLFIDVEFYINDDVDEETAGQTRNLLIQGGAVETEPQGTSTQLNSETRFSLDCVSHVIAKSEDFPEYRFCIEPSAQEGPELGRPTAVTPEWVRRSAQLGLLQKPRHYSCLKSMIFSGLCVAAIASKMARADREVIGNVVPAYGGVWREDVYGDVNVLLTSSLASKRVAAFLRQNSDNLILAAPNWINDSWRARKLLPLDNYRFDPNSGLLPPCLTLSPDTPAPSSPARFTSAASPSPDKSVFKNKCVLLSRDIGRASEQQVRSLEHFIRVSGGTVRRAPVELRGIAQAVRNSDYIVCRFRDVQEYREAIRQNKVVANLAWLITVISNDVMTDPKAEPLHYPIPRAEIPELKGLAVTVTSYRGEQRAYIVKLIKLLGATFDGSLTRSTNLCVAANNQSEKTLKARDWSVPVVNHRYIVDCFLSWAAVERDNLRYIDFPDGVDYGKEVGTARVTDDSLGPWVHDALEADEPADLPASDAGIDLSSTGGPSSTNENQSDAIGKVEAMIPDQTAESNHSDVLEGQSTARPALAEIDASMMNHDDTPSKEAPRKRKAAEVEPIESEIATPQHTPRGKTSRKVSTAEELTPPASDAEDEVNEQLASKPFPQDKRSTPASTPSKVGDHEIRIVTSNFTLKKEEVVKLRRFGIHVVEKIEEADMLVTPKLSRSPKMLYAIANGSIDIIEPGWVEACLQAESIVPGSQYKLRDAQGEKSYSIKLKDVLKRRGEYPNGIYEGHNFWLARGVDEGGSFKALIRAAGGQVLAGPRDESLLFSDSEHYHFIVDESHKGEWKDLLGQLTVKGEPLRLYRRELISDGIFTQQLRWDHQYVDLEKDTTPTTPKNKSRQSRTSLSNSSGKRSRGRPTM